MKGVEPMNYQIILPSNTKILLIVFVIWAGRLTWLLFTEKQSFMKPTIQPNLSNTAAFSQANYQRLVQFGQAYSNYENSEIRMTLRVMDLNQINSQQVQKGIRQEFEGVFEKMGLQSGTVAIKDLGFDVFEIVMEVQEGRYLKEIEEMVGSDSFKNSVINNLVGSMSGVVLSSQEYQMDPAIVERVQAIIGGLPMGYQVFMSNTNNLMQEVGKSFQRSQQYLMDGIRINEALKEDSVYYTQQANKLQSKLQQLEKQLEKTEKALESSEAEFSQKSRVYSHDQKILEQQVQQLVKQIMDLEGVNTQLRNERSQLDEEQDRLQEQIVGIEEKLGQVKDVEVVSKNKAMSLQQEYSSLIESKKATENDLRNVQIAVSEVYGALGSAVDIEKVRPEVVRAISPRVLALNAQVKEMEDVILERNARIKQILLELDNLSLKKQEYLDTINSYTTQIEELQTKLSYNEQKLVDLGNQVEQQSLKITERTQERTELQQQVSMQCEEIRRITSEMEELEVTCGNYASILKLMRGFASEITTEYNDLVHQVEVTPPVTYTTTTSKKTQTFSTDQSSQQF
eukprot:TRINITY_DN12132_c0_g1_i2.p1 TRINITY_DN12132_c0_g1~~TRINITY_DN12132_c0_g1_i2.p1  ORF type:complete len:569 (+),score=91.99 TRINITY_DN12132_c0_g1_i2:44-1750(+)